MTAPTPDLVFASPPATSAALVFGATDGTGADTDIEVRAALPGLTLAATLAPSFAVSALAQLPALTVAATLGYDVRVERPITSHAESDWQVGDAITTGRLSALQSPIAMSAGIAARHQRPTATSSRRDLALRGAKALRSMPADVRQARASTLGTALVSLPHQDATRVGQVRRTWAASAIAAHRVGASGWEETLRDRRTTRHAPWQSGVLVARIAEHRSVAALNASRAWQASWQQAWVPRPGRWTPPVVPPWSPCYTPDPHLVFSEAPGTTDLVFRCHRDTAGETVVVPIQRVYVVINDVSLIRLPDGFPLDAGTLSLSADVDSFQIGFDATLPGSAFDEVMPAPDPVELEARINGTVFRLVVDSVSRDRTFGKRSVRISGRGWAAELAAPIAPVQTWSNAEARTAQQLAAATLPLGWSLDWALDDWLVPAGAWGFSGAPAAAVARIAEAAGGYVVPGRASKTLSVRHRYPAAPWAWSATTPDLVLPADVVTKESLRVEAKADYDAVFVSGETHGVLGHVVRAGSAGSRMAPMVTDALIADVVAVRQRGRAVLSDTGLQILPTLELPVLPETGIIAVGTFVEFLDGATTRRGIVRASRVSASFPKVRQAIEVETHA